MSAIENVSRRRFLAGGIIAAGAQALATILFTASFSIAAQHQLFAETFVLQQTQPLIAIVLVLCSVFVPVAFLGGITGLMYRQFAITIATMLVRRVIKLRAITFG